jgi:3-deoxy-manno-octulosonate cytidylyltransferase (CMP-KDO synthetase)
MITQKNTAIIIPARLAAIRLPNKPLIDINGEPMILHVWRRACDSNLGKVIVATDSIDIQNIIKNNGGVSLLTSSEHHSGTDRIFEALEQYDKSDEIKYIINLQGDLPTIDSNSLLRVLRILENQKVSIGTLVVKIKNKEDLLKPQIVKAVCEFKDTQENARAMDFQRTPENISPDNLYHHIGIYSYTKESLKQFVKLSQTSREISEKLEQLRALENNIHIEAGLIDFLPLGVDTPEDLEIIKEQMTKI